LVTDDVWVFAYGSLIWDPGFEHDRADVARLSGWRRGFSMWSVHYRGTPAAPGLVLALQEEAGSFCDGIAYRVAPGRVETAIAALRARELVSDAYTELCRPVRLADGREVMAIVYVILPGHPQFCAGLDPEAEARIIASASGVRGPNAEYLWSTAARLAGHGIADPALDWLAARVRVLRGAVTGDGQTFP
jgi:glutathione-specific gamma-glutamylcyclotransferase